MEYQIIHAILSLRPAAEVSIVGNSLSGIDWHDKTQDRPTDSAINAEIAKAGDVTEMKISSVERGLFKQREEQKIMKKNIEKILELLQASAAGEGDNESKDTSQRRKSTVSK